MPRLLSLRLLGWLVSLLGTVVALPLRPVGSTSPWIPSEVVSSGLVSGCPFVESRIFVADDVQYSSDLFSCSGAERYVDLQRQWYETLLPSLADARFSVLRVAPLSESRVEVAWNLSFVAENTAGLVSSLGSLPGVRLRYFDILDKERLRSVFSWGALGRTIGRLLLTGELALPQAVILGTSEMTFALRTNASDETPFVLVGQKDSLKLVRSLDRGYLKNRKLTFDLLEFVDASRPPFVSFEDWNDIIVRRLNTRSVPGMGQFDVDGIEGTQSETVERVVANLLRIAVPIGLALLLFSKYVLDVDILPTYEDNSSEFYF